MTSRLDAFTLAYFECAEFTDCTPDNPEMESSDGFSEEFYESSKRDCARFQEENSADLELYEEVTGRDMRAAGHDFWLTRNGHGAGFWDRGNHPVLRRLTDTAHSYGTVDLYVGDDNMIYGG